MAWYLYFESQADFVLQKVMSALLLKADVCDAPSDVGYGSTSGHTFTKLNLIKRELRLGCLRVFGARRGAAVRYVHSLVFILEVFKHEQADCRG